ncbi:hypothetical protein B0T16DRAFT_77765 [Cercophora newfieldiana]|uniref:Uncharacterized protein n=1 Tax=Cercophora newfieldiana TaxID=92897 RepID=A0AA40CUQ7_9PEZI|nr:hypothetical protein B0T16DRAFT_77765 [Cercophora newfieldiana]
MGDRGGNPAVPPVTPGRQLRPRQAPESRVSPAGATPRSGRVTRSSAGNPGSANGGNPTTPDRRKRTRHQSGFYVEDSDDDEIASSPVTPVVRPPQSARAQSLRSAGQAIGPSPSKRRAVAATPKKSAANKSTPGKATPRRATPHKPTPRKLARIPLAGTPPPSSVVVLDWAHRVPYSFWVQTFKYASAPLDDGDQVDWLLATSRVCRDFAEAALTVLYQCPPLLTRPMAHRLVDLLARDPTTTKYNYRPKVEKLRIDVQEIAAKTYRGQPLDFKTLIACLPRLQVVDFSHGKDLPPFRSLDDSLRWQYPDSLFEALNGMRPRQAGEDEDAQPVRLIGWRWNRRMMGLDTSPSRVKTLHSTPTFANLKKLGLVNYQVPSLRHPGKTVSPELSALDTAYIQELAEAICLLQNLEYLSVESSTVVNDEFLSLLPKSLRFLELVNCWEVGGEDFATYLLSHGQKLEEINLRHNQSLSLAFLTVLGTACPNLQSLCVDLKNYNHHEFYNDSEPNYAAVLTVDQVPVWPESLQRVELRNMKKWSAEAAEMLLQSLVDSAPNLPHLRELDIKTMLDIPFRQRSALRDKWEAKLKRVFLRKEEDPKPLFTLRPLPPVKDDAEASRTIKKSPRKRARILTESESETRRSSRIAALPSNPSSRDSSIVRDSRGARARPIYAEVDTDADDEDNEEEASDETGKSDAEDGTSPSAGEREEEFRHGMCDKVEIQLDNQKIAEVTWQMDDFLDEEASDNPSDEDWDGDQEADTGYAW